MRTSTIPPGARHRVELPEAIVHAVYRHARHAPSGRLIADHRLDDDHRGDRGERAREGGVGGDVGGQLFAEKARRDDDLIGAAEAIEHQIPQAAADRVADQQRAAEHRHRGRDAEHHRGVGAPVVPESVSDEAAVCHVLINF
jgi:hypothetical protein